MGSPRMHRGICWNNIEEVVRALGNVVCFTLSVRKLKYWIYHICLRLSHVCFRRFELFKSPCKDNDTVLVLLQTPYQPPPPPPPQSKTSLFVRKVPMYTPPTRYRYQVHTCTRYRSTLHTTHRPTHKE